MILAHLNDANRAEAVALARTIAAYPEHITSVELNDAGTVSAVGLGVDADGFARFILNFEI